VASEIMTRFLERRMLEEFDPSFEVVHDGKVRPARFKSFLSGFVAVYVQHHRDRQATQSRREPLKCDQPVGEGGAAWIDVFGGSSEDDYSEVEESEFVALLRVHLASVPRRSKHDVCDLPALFESVVRMVRVDGRIDTKQLQNQFGVSNTAIHSWLKHMREQLVPVLAEYRESYDQYRGR
jgi:DNA-directed RNA polymerase specialized sigma24 family protein